MLNLQLQDIHFGTCLQFSWIAPKSNVLATAFDINWTADIQTTLECKMALWNHGTIGFPEASPQISSVTSVAQSCRNLCNPTHCSTPGFPVHHQLPELAQTHVHGVSDTIQPSHPLSSPSPAFNPQPCLTNSVNIGKTQRHWWQLEPQVKHPSLWANVRLLTILATKKLLRDASLLLTKNLVRKYKAQLLIGWGLLNHPKG